jgi:hypothetical protein
MNLEREGEVSGNVLEKGTCGQESCLEIDWGLFLKEESDVSYKSSKEKQE